MTPSSTPYKTSFKLLSSIVMAALLAGCPPKATQKKSGTTDTASGSAQGASGADGETFDPETDTGELPIRGGETFEETPDLGTVRFEYDAYSLGREARETLRKNAEYIKNNPGIEVLVEGHCDERGTSEYNLALGQNRAKAVRDYYRRLGVSGRKIATISYGEENPICSEAAEDCWKSNRRAHTKIRPSSGQ